MTEQLALIATHLWQSTLFAGAAALLALLLRANHARTRYVIWLVASAKFLVPFSALVAIGRQFAFETQTSLPPRALAAVESFATPFNAPEFVAVNTAAASLATQTESMDITALLAVVWLGGALFLIGLWCRQWLQVRRALRSATPVSEGRELDILRRVEHACGSPAIPLLASNGSLEPGIVGCLHPVILWPVAIGEHLSDEQISAILLHELAHIKRRDNLSALLHMGVQATFWFYPLVWWIGARLVDERERACDEEVVRFGVDPHQYAESILRTCEFAVESPLPCVAGVTGADLKRRVMAIVNHRPALRLGASKVALLTAFGLVVAVGPLAAGALSQSTRDRLEDVVKAIPNGFVDVLEPIDTTRPLPQSEPSDHLSNQLLDPLLSVPLSPMRSATIGFGAVEVAAAAPSQASFQTSLPAGSTDATGATSATGAALKFDVASIKLIREDGNAGPAMVSGVAGGGAGVATNRFNFAGPINQLVMRAYGIRDAQLVGAPAWLGSDDANYRIAATLPEGVAGTAENVSAMIRSLLTDRFKLVAREETREMPIYELVIASRDKALGPNLTAVAPECLQPGNNCETRMGGRGGGGTMNLEGRNQTIPQLATGPFGIERRLDRLLIDKTGLTGRYNFDLKYADPRLSLAPTELPTLADALKDQLGLKLESARGPVRVVTVVSIARPTED